MRVGTFLTVVMPGHGEIDDQEIQDLVQNGGLKSDTLQKRKKVGADFTKFVDETLSTTVKELLALERSVLEQAIIKYFGTLTVSQRKEDGSMVQVVPKRNTLDGYRSNLKQFILIKSDMQIDITGNMFTLFAQFFKSLGRGETSHHQPIDKESLENTVPINVTNANPI